MKKFDYVIVLGNAPGKAGRISRILVNRMNVALRLYKKGMAKRLLLSGGIRNPSDPVPEAVRMERYLVRKGVKRDDIVKETRSTMTLGNAYFTKKLLGDIRGLRIAVVTSEFHVKRSRFIFSRVFGTKITFIPSKTPPRLLPGLAKLEGLALDETRLSFRKFRKNAFDGQLIGLIHGVEAKLGLLKK
ncbi:MAG: YdcF family protein [Candidatus Micrarchaeota archaeon]|nr:YdcF family protein [Candidatus Micrarchaeota archaeon]MDE1834400.1 YdcF family protein [Candidatus Micrarchaeota archaeon]MDE1859064.1 YdcF family protein [Candidatus Micrarchaeota archaeon]